MVLPLHLYLHVVIYNLSLVAHCICEYHIRGPGLYRLSALRLISKVRVSPPSVILVTRHQAMTHVG